MNLTQKLPFFSILILASWALGQTQPQPILQTQEDGYTRYELLDPETQSFRIIYDVTATAAGARRYFNTIRPGSEPAVNAVYDMKTGKELAWKIADGGAAKLAGHARANENGQYIQVELARPVPQKGGSRIRIDKVYKDPKSYFSKANTVTFKRTLGVKRNAVVFPKGFELIGCNYPSQVVMEADGRIKISFLNRGPSGVPLTLTGRHLPENSVRTSPEKLNAVEPREETRSVTSTIGARTNFAFSERAFQNREIVYFLNPPETHSFFLYHDYTETREGVDKYLNIVRKGSKASEPSAINLDTGENLKVEQLKGEEIAQRGILPAERVDAETEVVVIWFDPVKKGQSTRLRIAETYTDPNRYLLVGETLVWDRSFGRAHNTVLLPEGWFLTTSSIPAVVDEAENGRIRLHFINDRPGNIDVFLKARRR